MWKKERGKCLQAWERGRVSAQWDKRIPSCNCGKAHSPPLPPPSKHLLDKSLRMMGSGFCCNVAVLLINWAFQADQEQ